LLSLSSLKRDGVTISMLVGGPALAVIAIYLESATLPGADATLAHTIAKQMIETVAQFGGE
jgi:hypothetical protein